PDFHSASSLPIHIFILPCLFFSDFPFLCRVGLADLHHYAAQDQKGQRVGNDHQAVEEISQRPYQIHIERRTYYNKYDYQQRIHLRSLPAEQVLRVDLSEKMPPQNRREGEEQKADRHKDISKASKIRSKRCL